MRSTRASLVIAVALAVFGGCRSTPPAEAPEPDAMPSSTAQLVSLGEYALSLRQQDETALIAEKDRLEAEPASPERDLRLALVLGQRTAAYDPQRAASLLAQLSVSDSVDASSKAIAEALMQRAASAAGARAK